LQTLPFDERATNEATATTEALIAAKAEGRFSARGPATTAAAISTANLEPSGW